MTRASHFPYNPEPIAEVSASASAVLAPIDSVTNSSKENNVSTTWIQGVAVDDRVIAARQALSDAEEAADEASRAVDDLREKVALNLIEKGKLLIGQRRLSKLIEEREQAKAALRANEKVAAADKAERDAQHKREIDAEGKVISAETRRLELEQRQVIAEAIASMDRIDRQIRRQQAEVAAFRGRGGHGRMPVPVSQLEAVYGPITAGMLRLLRLLPSERELGQGPQS